MKQLNKQKMMILILLVFGLTTAVNLQAQERGPHHPPMLPDSARVEKMIDDMTHELSLSNGQQTKIKELMTAHFNEVQTLMEEGKAAREQQREKMDANKKQFEGQIASVLTKDQLDGWKQFMESHRPAKGMKRGDRH